MKRIFGFLILSLVFHDLSAQIIWDGTQENIPISHLVYQLEDSSKALTIEEVAQLDDEFQLSNRDILNYGFSRSAQWLKFDLSNTTDNTIILELAQAFLPNADLYFMDIEGNWVIKRSGFEVDLHEKEIPHHFQLFTLPIGVSEFYVRLIAHAHPVEVNIWDERAYQFKATKQKLIYGLQTGILLFVILNNLFLFFSLRKRIYLHYAILTLTYLGVAGFVMEGYFQYLFSTADVIYWYLLTPNITAAVALSYCMSFVETRKYDPKIYKFARIMLYFYISYIFWHQLLPLHIVVALNQLTAVVVLFLQGYLAIRAGLKGNKFGYYYAGAYFIYLILVIIEAIYIQTGVPKHVFEISYVSIGSFVEVIFLAYALSKRFEWEQKEAEAEKREAQKKLLEKTIENEKITLEKNKKLEEVDKVKDQFLANTSHELRTPLNGIIGLSESLQERMSSADDREDLLLITSSGKRLASLVNDLLDFSKLKNFDIQLQLKNIDLRSLVDIVIRVFQPQILNENLQIINSIPNDLKAVVADENRLQQILQNLISNAVKFTQEGKIEISAKDNGGRAKITVSDTGIGIPIDKQDSIFESFQQADGSISRNYGGTGLGLSITRQLIELHGSKIELNSEPGMGSSFSFDLTTSDEQGTVYKESQEISSIINDLVSPEVELYPEALKDDKDEIRILVVDDEAINRKVMANHFRDGSFNLEFASSGPEALAILDSNDQIDLVLLDVMMPHMSGYDVCEKIRKKYLPSDLPVILVTAKNQVTDLVQGLRIGANDYISKPFSKQELLARVNTQLDLHRIFKVTGRFVPNEFIRSIGRDRITEVKVGDLAKQEVTVLFSDIRDYTTLVESMSPEENFKLIQAFCLRMGPVISKHNGFINQYLGDAIMAIFPISPDDALRAAIEMQESLQGYNIERSKKNRKSLRVGIGLHSGPLIMGIIGDEYRMDVATIADTVNTASRIENLNKFYYTSILISEKTYSNLENSSEYNIRDLGSVRVKGKQQAVGVYECFDGQSQEEIELKLMSLAYFEEGLNHYHNKDFSKSLMAFDRALSMNKGDATIKKFLDHAANNIANPVSDDWTSVVSMNDIYD